MGKLLQLVQKIAFFILSAYLLLLLLHGVLRSKLRHPAGIDLKTAGRAGFRQREIFFVVAVVKCFHDHTSCP